MTFLGVVVDSVTRETLPNAHVYVDRANGPHGTTTNLDGEYELAGVNPGELLRITYVGYTGETMELPDVQPAPFVHGLEPGVALDEFEVTATRPKRYGIAVLLAAIAYAATR